MKEKTMTLDFDKALTKTVSGAKFVAGKAAQTATTVIDYTKLQIDRAAIRDQIRSLYLELGKLYYADQGTGCNSAEIRECILKLDEQIYALKNSEHSLSEKKKDGNACGFCSAKNPADGVFCCKCGEKL
jgi:ribosomal protein L40E